MTENSIVLTIAKNLLEQGRSVLGIVACQNGDGATRTLWAIAEGLRDYQKNWRILLVDANLRNPTLSNSADPSLPGWVELVERGEAVRFEPTAARQERISVLPAVTRGPRQDGIVLDQTRLRWLRETLVQARQHHDVVLVDLPPVLRGDAEAEALAPLVDEVILVVRACRTRKPVITEAVNVLENVHARPAGMILNKRPMPIPKWLYQRFF